MAVSINSRSNNAVCGIATGIILVVGILGFMYVGQQMSHGSRFDPIIQSSKTAP